MGFAAGFAAGYKAVEDAKQNEIARKEKIDKDAKALKEAESKSMKDSFDYVSKHNDSMSKLQENLASATNADEWNKANSDMANSAKAFSEFANYNMENGIVPKQAQKVYEQANLNNYEPVETVTIKNYKDEEVSVSIPKSMAENKDSISLMENGKIGIAQMGDDGKIAGYQPTDISPTKFKATEVEDKKVFVAISPDGKKVTDAFSDSEINSLQQKGFRFETSYKPKDTTIINSGGSSDKSGERSPVGKAIKDWETYNSDLKDSNPEEYNLQRKQFIQDSFQAKVEGVGGVGSQKKNEKMVGAMAISADILDKDSIDSKDVNKLKMNQASIISNTGDAASRKVLVDTNAELKGMNATISQLDNLDKDIGKYMKDDKLKKGLVDNIEQTANEMIGLSDSQKKNLVAIDVNTRLGIVQARFIKLMSGATVSDKERAFYTDVIGTNNWNDETALAQKVKSFSRQMKNDYSSIAEQYKNELPHSYYQATQYSDKVTKQRTEVTGTDLNEDKPKVVAKEIIQNGWVYDAETKQPLRKAN